MSQDTWAFDAQRKMAVRDVVAWCHVAMTQAARQGEAITGITISGGEPFDQPEGLRALLAHLRKTGPSAAADVLCYSGYPLKTLQDKHAPILDLLDVLIPEPYVDALPIEKRWRGSANQTLHLLSERGRTRYADWLEAPAQKEMQVAVEGSSVWFIGLPHRGDMPQLEALCRARGIDFGQVSWRR